MRVGNANIHILFIAGFGPIVRETVKSRKLYGDVMKIPFKEQTGEYLHTEALSGAKTFALWPLSQAAQSCFSKDSWPDNVPIPQAWLEFDVSVRNALRRDPKQTRPAWLNLLPAAIVIGDSLAQ